MNKNTNQKILKKNVDVRLDKKKVKVEYNPPPQDMRCYCCGRHPKELKQFDEPEHFKGAFLVKRWRYDFPEVKSPYNISDFLTKDGDFDRKKFLEKYDEKEIDLMFSIESMNNIIGSSWECRDCIYLDRKEYHERMRKASEKREKQHELNNLSSTK